MLAYDHPLYAVHPFLYQEQPVPLWLCLLIFLGEFPADDRLSVCLPPFRKPVLIAYHHYGWWLLTTQSGNLFSLSLSLSLSFKIFWYFPLLQRQLKHWGVTGWAEGSWCWGEVEWRNGNGMGKMGMENGARGGRTKVVGWFMVLDLGGMGWWLWGEL